MGDVQCMDEQEYMEMEDGDGINQVRWENVGNLSRLLVRRGRERFEGIHQALARGRTRVNIMEVVWQPSGDGQFGWFGPQNWG